MKTSIQQKADRIIEDFEYFEDWSDKYEHLIDLAKTLPKISEEDKTEKNLVAGCQSRVWLKAIQNESENDTGAKTMYFTADSDAIITKGLIALIISVVQNERAEDIANYDFNFIETIGLSTHLSPTRANGLSGMIQKIKQVSK